MTQTCGTFGAPLVDCKCSPLLSCQVWFFTSKHLPLQSSTESKRARASIWHLSDRLSVEAFTLKMVEASVECQRCQAVFVLLSPVWNRPMSLCCKTSSMLSTSRVYTLFYGQTDWFEKCSASLDDRRSDMFFLFILQWRFTMAILSLFFKRNAFVWRGGFAENGENTAPIDPSIERRTYSYMDINTFRMSLEYHTEGETSEGTTLRTVHKTCSLLETLKFIIRILKSRCY